MVKKLLCLFLAVVTLFSLSGCIDTVVGSAFFLYLCATDNDDRADKKDIIAFVCKNEEAIREAVENKEFSQFENKDIVKRISTNENCVDFSCGGAGMGSETAYTGFFYTADDDMTAVWCAPSSKDSMEKLGNGYEWKESSGDNRYYTEKICDNFYYYEAEY